MTTHFGIVKSFGVMMLSVGCLMLGGCGYKPKLPPLAKVTGRITYKGKPLPFGQVRFIPDTSKGEMGPPGKGEIQPDGTYEVFTAKQRGAAVGRHTVCVRAIQMSDDPQIAGPDMKGLPNPSILPSRYDRPAESGLSADVKADTDNVFNFDLKP
ncbi:MAG: hypothetical protein JW818_08755 [Pirellulales bacterium]|nr:hypothetical protein [Pirellulales bacterium]